jgi:hypothetical protein
MWLVGSLVVEKSAHAFRPCPRTVQEHFSIHLRMRPAPRNTFARHFVADLKDMSSFGRGRGIGEISRIDTNSIKRADR